DLGDAVHCSGELARANRNVVLVIPGTTLAPENYAWNWVRALAAMHWPYCTVALPDRGMNDVQVAAEYVVYAIRRVSAASGRRVDIVGHSQGGMAPRWTLRFWPDTRP